MKRRIAGRLASTSPADRRKHPWNEAMPRQGHSGTQNDETPPSSDHTCDCCSFAGDTPDPTLTLPPPRKTYRDAHWPASASCRYAAQNCSRGPDSSLLPLSKSSHPMTVLQGWLAIPLCSPLEQFQLTGLLLLLVLVLVLLSSPPLSMWLQACFRWSWPVGINTPLDPARSRLILQSTNTLANERACVCVWHVCFPWRK